MEQADLTEDREQPTVSGALAFYPIDWVVLLPLSCFSVFLLVLLVSLTLVCLPQPVLVLTMCFITGCW